MTRHSLTPTYSLEEVRRVWKLAVIGRTVVRRAEQHYPGSDPEVEAFIGRTIRSLKQDDFVHSKEQEYGIMADVYAVENDDGSWYIKFYIEHGRVTVVSCHAPEHDLPRANGTIVKAGI